MVREKGTYGETILRRSWDILQPSIASAQRAAEQRTGCKLKIIDVHLVPVASEQREVYDVMLTMVPDIPVPATPPEAGNASI
jgi:hypothetical protein